MIDYRIAAGGMGQAFTPPNHPSQQFHVEADLKRRKENRGGMNIEYALTEKYVPQSVKDQIKKMLNEWEANKLPLNHPETKKWLNECKRHWDGLPKELKSYINKYYPEWKLK